MKNLFNYNWQVREQWFEWCKQFSLEQLVEERTGGFGNILETLLHIVIVEYDWIHDMATGVEFQFRKDDYQSLEDVVKLHHHLHPEVEDFINNWSEDRKDTVLVLDNGKRAFTFGEVMNHVIVHEIHHIGQLSVWARELGVDPVSANFIGRNLR